MPPSESASLPAHVLLPGRHDLADLFRISGLFDGSEQKHHPFLVFDVRENEVVVRIVRRSGDLLNFPPETQVMAQWPGQWRSDWFHFSVYEYAQWVNQRERTPTPPAAAVRPTAQPGDDDFGSLGGFDDGSR